MNHDRQPLLNDLLPTDRAPGIDSILAGLRRDRATRSAQRSAAGILAATLLFLVTAVLATRPDSFAKNLPGNLVAAAQATQSTFLNPAPFTETPEVHRLTDDELQAAIAGPSAIVTLPDGRKSLLVLVPTPAKKFR